jgi:urease subunit alpha
VLWSPAFFGVKPDMVLLGGSIACRADGRPERLDPDAAAGALPADVRRLSAARRRSSSVTFVSQAALEAGLTSTARRTPRSMVAVENTRGGIPRHR